MIKAQLFITCLGENFFSPVLRDMVRLLEWLGVDAPADPIQLAAIARAKLRQEFLAADMGISGANFMVAETGTLVLVSNEGNGRMCTTLPPLHVAVVGIDKVVPDGGATALLRDASAS